MFFPKGIFPRATSQVTISQVTTFQKCNFSSGNFIKIRLGLLRHGRLQCGLSAVARTGYNWGRALRLGQPWGADARDIALFGSYYLGKYTWEVTSWEIAHLISCHLGKYPQKVALWKIAHCGSCHAFENTLRKFPLEKMPSRKYLTSQHMRPFFEFFWLFSIIRIRSFLDPPCLDNYVLW